MQYLERSRSLTLHKIYIKFLSKGNYSANRKGRFMNLAMCIFLITLYLTLKFDILNSLWKYAPDKIYTKRKENNPGNRQNRNMNPALCASPRCHLSTFKVLRRNFAELWSYIRKKWCLAHPDKPMDGRMDTRTEKRPFSYPRPLFGGG